MQLAGTIAMHRLHHPGINLLLSSFITPKKAVVAKAIAYHQRSREHYQISQPHGYCDQRAVPIISCHVDRLMMMGLKLFFHCRRDDMLISCSQWANPHISPSLLVPHWLLW